MAVKLLPLQTFYCFECIVHEGSDEEEEGDKKRKRKKMLIRKMGKKKMKEIVMDKERERGDKKVKENGEGGKEEG